MFLPKVIWEYKSQGMSSIKQTVNLDNRRTDNNGFLLIAVRSLFFPHPDVVLSFTLNTLKWRAISLHKTKDNEDVTKNDIVGLVDAVVFRSESAASVEFEAELLALLTPGEQEIYESAAFSEREEGISRCSMDGGLQWIVAHLSPKAQNHCPNRNGVLISINEVSLSPSEQFIELWDHGFGFTSLGE